MGGVSSAETNERTAESAEQDQTAHMCTLILLYALRRINLWQDNDVLNVSQT